MYLDHTFARKTFAQRIGSAKVKSKSEVTQCVGTSVFCTPCMGHQNVPPSVHIFTIY